MGVTEGTLKVYATRLKAKNKCRTMSLVVNKHAVDTERRKFLSIWNRLNDHAHTANDSLLYAIVTDFAKELLS